MLRRAPSRGPERASEGAPSCGREAAPRECAVAREEVGSPGGAPCCFSLFFPSNTRVCGTGSVARTTDPTLLRRASHIGSVPSSSLPVSARGSRRANARPGGEGDAPVLRERTGAPAGIGTRRFPRVACGVDARAIRARSSS